MGHPNEDPLLASARREAVIAMAVWFVAMVYSVTVCYWFGYGRELADLTYVLGFPDWVFWGIVVPWSACVVFSTWFAMFYMRDEELGPEQPSDDELEADWQNEREEAAR